MKIICLSSHHTVRFAAEELARHIRKVTGQRPSISDRDQPGVALRLAVADDVGAVSSARRVAPDTDWILIRPERGGYLLSGPNPRCVLFAAYRYLRELGFAWIRPGRRGLIVPKRRSAMPRGIAVDEAASYPIRRICIEGACSDEHVCELIDWMAKHGMNGYFLQFHLGTQFFQRWHEHQESTAWEGTALPEATAVAWSERLIAELKRRDMLFERMGHGWLCDVLGVPGEGWGTFDGEVPEDRRDWMACVNGKRELWDGIPLNTNLNYGLPEVRTATVESIVRYAKEHAEVDLLHFWLADGCNNHCESAESAKARPADFYIDMLNELDEALNVAGLDTRIVFLIYVDLLWPPQRRKIRNPDRFVLMFAPITRSYLQSYADVRETPAVAPFRRNKLVFPKGAAENLAYLEAWQKRFDGESFVFDYHAIWACYYDPNMVTIARTLHRDIQALGKIGLDGLNSCQNQRHAFPHTLLMNVLARTLWDRRVSFKTIYDETFAQEYGEQGKVVGAFFERASRLWLPLFEPVFQPTRDAERIQSGKRNIPKLETLVAEIKPLVRERLAATDGAVRWSWRYLQKHLQLLDRLLPAMAAYLDASPETRPRFEAVERWLWQNEKQLHPALDVHMMVVVFRWRVHEAEEFATGEDSGVWRPL